MLYAGSRTQMGNRLQSPTMLGARHLCLLALNLLPVVSPAQETVEAFEARILSDPIAAALRMPVEKPPIRGNVLTALDVVTKEPVTGASIFWCVSRPAEKSRFNARLMERFTRSGALVKLGLACRFGHRLLANEHGQVRIPYKGRRVRLDVTVLSAGRIYTRQYFDWIGACALPIPRAKWLRVRITDANKKPAAAIPVQCHESHSSGGWARLTDASGLALVLVPVPLDKVSRFRVSALLGVDRPVQREFESADVARLREPVELELPATGSILVTVVDGEGVPRDDVIDVQLSRQRRGVLWIAPKCVDARASRPATRQQSSGGIFHHVIAGTGEVHVLVRLKGIHGQLRGKGMAPVRAGLVSEIVIRDTGILEPQILAKDGTLLRSASLNVSVDYVREAPIAGPFGVAIPRGSPLSGIDVPSANLRTDVSGRLRFAWPSKQFKAGVKVDLLVCQIQPGAYSHVRSMCRLRIDGRKPAIEAIQLTRPPRTAAGVVVDQAGEPLQSVSVSGPWASMQTGADGRFELRGVPTDNKIYLRFQKRGYAVKSFSAKSGRVDFRVTLESHY